jgi:hypothetical protein
MSMAVRTTAGRFENNKRAYEAATERQRDQLTRIFVGAGVPASTLRWGHTGMLSLNSLAAIVNFVSGTRLQVDEVHPSDYGLEAHQ